MDNCNCTKEQEIKDLKKEIASLKENQTDTEKDLILLKADVGYIKETLTEVRKIVEKLADAPVQSWNAVKKQALMFVVGGSLIGFTVYVMVTANKLVQ